MPQSGLSRARHITPTTIGVISMGSTRMPRTTEDPRRFRLKNMASATPRMTCAVIVTPTITALILTAFQNSGSRTRSP
jgi:hypothetical protein